MRVFLTAANTNAMRAHSLSLFAHSLPQTAKVRSETAVDFSNAAAPDTFGCELGVDAWKNASDDPNNRRISHTAPRKRLQHEQLKSQEESFLLY
jgi:hypothetical protein